jgi:hypothetical protein
MTALEKKVDYLGGQVKALFDFTTVLINTHQSLEDLREDFPIARMVGQAKTEAQAVSDEFLQGLIETYEQLADALEIAGKQD